MILLCTLHADVKLYIVILYQAIISCHVLCSYILIDILVWVATGISLYYIAMYSYIPHPSTIYKLAIASYIATYIIKGYLINW